MPNNKMERFTQRARSVLSLAQEEAERLHQKTIDTGHMLMGLLREEGGIAGRVLRDLGVEQQRLEELLTESAEPDWSSLNKTIELTSECKRVLELAVDEARRLAHHYIGTEHIILGLVRQTDSKAVNILMQLKVTPEQVRRQTRRVLQESPSHPDIQPQMNAEPASPVSERKQQPMTRPYSSAYQLLEKVIMKILQMIEDQKMTITQGVELVNALTPDLKLLPIQQAQLVGTFFELETLQTYQVRMNLTDAQGTEIGSESKIPLSKLLAEIDRFLATALNEPDTPLTFTLGDHTLKMQIEKAEANNAQ